MIVVGAGPAGLTAAIFAARSGAQVTLLEAMEKPGKKLLLTGNGRCNLSNTHPELSSQYHGSAGGLAARITAKFPCPEVRLFFQTLGLLTQEKNGYVYPYTAQSSSVLTVLLAEVQRLCIKLKLGEKITGIVPEQGENAWCVQTKTWQYHGDAVILACGSCAAPATGSDGSGYTLAETLGIRIVRPQPALTPLICQAPFLSAAAGVRCRASVSLLREGVPFCRESGELQWTKYGVSGIVVFQLSRFVSCASRKDHLSLEIDLLPDYTEHEICQTLLVRACELGSQKLHALLSGMISERLIPVLLKYAGKMFDGLSCQDLTALHAEVLMRTFKHLQLPVIGTKSFDVAQVCAGGIDAGELTETLESRRYPGLYFAGELIDVDGPCGGYNLHWAWASGREAGLSAACAEPKAV